MKKLVTSVDEFNRNPRGLKPKKRRMKKPKFNRGNKSVDHGSRRQEGSVLGEKKKSGFRITRKSTTTANRSFY